jgi:hypothetical protein
LELTVAPFGNFNGPCQRVKVIGKQCSHLLSRFQVKLVALEPEAVLVFNGLRTSVYCQQDILSLPVFSADIVDIVGDDEGDAEFFCS